jgi:hypothetical protein
MIRFILGVTFTVASFMVNAECASTGCTGVYVDKLYANAASGLIYIGTSGDEKAISCSAVADAYVTLDIAETGANAIYSTLLAAQMSNKLVSVRTIDNSPKCKIAYITLERQ